MNRLILLLALLTFALNPYAQSYGEIHGKVVLDDGSPVPGANVMTNTLSGEILVSTDSLGKFKIKPLEPATYQLITSFVGMHNDTLQGVVLEPNKILNIGKITLFDDSKLIEGEATVTTYTVKLIDPEETGLTTKTYDEIKNSPLIKSPMTYLTTVAPGITQGADGEVYFRGSRAGAVQYHIDGVKMTTDISRVPSAAIGSIQVYTGGVPAKYGDTTGGVVVIETRSFMDLYLKKKYSS